MQSEWPPWNPGASFAGPDQPANALAPSKSVAKITSLFAGADSAITDDIEANQKRLLTNADNQERQCCRRRNGKRLPLIAAP